MELFSRLSFSAWPYLSIAVFATTLHFFIEPLRWRIYLRQIKLGVLINIFWSAAFLSYFFPFKLGLAFRFGLLVKRLEQSPVTITALLTFDGFFYYAFFGLFGLASAIFLGASLHVSLAEIVLLALLLSGFMAIGYWWRQCRQHKNFHKEINQSLKKPSALAGKRSHLDWLVLLMLFFLDLSANVARHMGLFLAFGITSLSLGTEIALPIFAVVSGLFSLLPMGLGGYEAALIAGFVAAGQPAEAALTIAVANRALTLCVALIGGLAAHASIAIRSIREWRTGLEK